MNLVKIRLRSGKSIIHAMEQAHRRTIETGVGALNRYSLLQAGVEAIARSGIQEPVVLATQQPAPKVRVGPALTGIEVRDYPTPTTWDDSQAAHEAPMGEWEARYLLGVFKKDYPLLYAHAVQGMREVQEGNAKLPPATYCAPKPWPQGVAISLIDAEGRLAVSRRQHTRNYPNAWQTPGGTVRDGESPVAAILRELKEETGLELDLVNVYSLGSTLEYAPEGYAFEMGWFTAMLPVGSVLAHTEPHLNTEWEFVGAEKVRRIEMGGQHTPRLPEMYLKAIALHRGVKDEGLLGGAAE